MSFTEICFGVIAVAITLILLIGENVLGYTP